MITKIGFIRSYLTVIVLTDPRAQSIYDIALHLLHLLMSDQSDTRFGIDLRYNRRISVDSNQGQIVPNIFQLSSGETALLNLFLVDTARL